MSSRPCYSTFQPSNGHLFYLEYQPKFFLWPPRLGYSPTAIAHGVLLFTHWSCDASSAYQVCPTCSCLWITYVLFLWWPAISHINLIASFLATFVSQLGPPSSLFKCRSTKMAPENVGPNHALHPPALHFRAAMQLLIYNATHGPFQPSPTGVLKLQMQRFCFIYCCIPNAINMRWIEAINIHFTTFSSLFFFLFPPCRFLDFSKVF